MVSNRPEKCHIPATDFIQSSNIQKSTSNILNNPQPLAVEQRRWLMLTQQTVFLTNRQRLCKLKDQKWIGIMSIRVYDCLVYNFPPPKIIKKKYLIKKKPLKNKQYVDHISQQDPLQWASEQIRLTVSH